jgi:hypothetical protein
MINIEKITAIAARDDRIVLLRCAEVIKWLIGDFSFLPGIKKRNRTADAKSYKVLEDEWGRNILKTLRRPDLVLDKQWTSVFGEYIVQELYMMQGENPKKPACIKGLQPDWEIEDRVIEVKTGTYWTSGTAHEKIYGVPHKYADIPELYGKPLVIVCVGGAEEICRNKFRILGQHASAASRRFIDFYKEQGFSFMGVTDIMKSIIESDSEAYISQAMAELQLNKCIRKRIEVRKRPQDELKPHL